MKTTGIRQHKFSAHIPKLLETESVIILFSINPKKKKKKNPWNFGKKVLEITPVVMYFFNFFLKKKNVLYL